MKKSKEEHKFCNCGNIISLYYSDQYDTCYGCREVERDKKTSLYLRGLEDRFGFEKNSMVMVTGGYDQDNDLQAFNDYYDTLLRMKGELEEKGCESPFTIISQKEVYNHAGSGNSLRFIAIDYDVDIEMKDLYDIEKYKGIVKKVAINERDYILSQKWIKEWVFKDRLGTYEYSYRLMLTDGKKAIITGDLVLT